MGNEGFKLHRDTASCSTCGEGTQEKNEYPKTICADRGYPIGVKTFFTNFKKENAHENHNKIQGSRFHETRAR